jgi:hypothetical protein
VITEYQQNQLWYVIKDMVDSGVSPKEFKREAAASWEQALRDRLRDEPRDIAE